MVFKLSIVEAKIQTFYMQTKGKKKNGDAKTSTTPIKVGSYVEFNDGNEYTVRETGVKFQGKGTRVRFNFKHKTISVQRPDTVNTTPSGAVVTNAENQPVWVEQKESGFTETQFKDQFGKTLVALAYAGHEQAIADAAAKKAA